MWEKKGVARIGVECYYTGRQRLEENPYRSFSEPYVSVGLLAERRIGPVRVFRMPKSGQCPGDAVGPVASASPRRRWEVDFRCMGSAGWPGLQWRGFALASDQRLAAVEEVTNLHAQFIVP